jgi:hypothetical protein
VHCPPFSAERKSISRTLVSNDIEERKRGRADAAEFKLVPGKSPDMARHIPSCPSVSDTVKVSVSQYMKDKVPIDARSPLKSRNSAVRSGSGPSAPAIDQLGPSSGKKRKQSSISDYGVYRKHHRLNTNEHARLIADAIFVSKVPVQVFAGETFRRLQEFYVGGSKMLKVSGLIVNVPKVRNLILPLRYSKALASLQSFVRKCPLADEYTLADDGWESRRKSHYCVTSIARPDIPPETIALTAISATELHAVAIPRRWERLINLANQERPIAEYSEGFASRSLDVRTRFAQTQPAQTSARGRSLLYVIQKLFCTLLWESVCSNMRRPYCTFISCL